MTDKRVSQSGVAVVRDGAAAARFSDFGVAAVYLYPGVQVRASQFGVAVVRSKEAGDGGGAAITPSQRPALRFGLGFR